MRLFYDVQLKNGDIIEDCYFIKYLKPLKSVFGMSLTYVEDCIKCFDKTNAEITEVDFSESEILRIHDEDGNDLTELLTEKHEQICDNLGHYVDFPIFREQVLL